MSPEQVTGDELDGRSDLYSLGILAFFALCGRFPFERPTASAVVVAHVTSTPPKLCSVAHGVPSALGDIVDRLLAKSPNDRYASGQLLRDALDALPLEHMALAVTQSAPYIARTPTLGSESAAPFALLAPSDDQAEMLSSADAEQIWARAAQLQANTGLIVPPSSFQLSNAAAPSDTVGFDAAVVRASAVDAGIDSRYVDRAMQERARAAALKRPSGGGTLSGTIADSASQPPNVFLGARTKIELETSFEGELNELGFEEVADEIRAALGEMITVSAVGRTLTVTSAGGGGGRNHQPRRVQIYLTSRNGRTIIRAFEDLKQTAASMFIGLTLGGGLGAGGMLSGIIMGATQNPAIALPAMGCTVVLGFGIARLLYTRTARKREKELREVMQRVVTRAQDSLPTALNARLLPRR